jgi:DNA-binding beta-propeller fold protein YncE
MTTKHITTALALAVSALVLATAENAFALGQISYGGCVSATGSGGLCAPTGNKALTNPSYVAISPDGGSLYAAGQNGSGISVFRRAPHGQLAYDGCVSDDGSSGACAKLPGNLLGRATSVAVSPDGHSAYTTGGDKVVAFARAAGGQLTYAGCVSDDGSGGLCANAPGAPFQVAEQLAISPDGTSVYVAAPGSSALSVLDRAPGGQLTYAGCVSADGSGGLCADAPGTQLATVYSVGVSPDGRTVHAVDFQNDSVITFDRARGGQISFAGCVSDSGSGGVCAKAPGTSLDGPTHLALSPDGTSLYVTTSLSRGVAVFDRVPSSGHIAYAGCVSNDGSGGTCADLPGTPLIDAQSVVVSPDARTVYARSLNSGVVVALDRAPTGQITYAGCVSDDGSGGLCADLPGTPLYGGGHMAISPDGGSLYAPGFTVDAVTHLFRKSAPDTSILSGPADGATVATQRPSFKFASDQEGATFECSLDGGLFGGCGATATLGPLADGRHRLAVRAVTGGDPDPTPEVRSFSVDTAGPAVSLTRAPKRKLKTTKRRVNVKFAFRSPEQGARFTCKLDRRAATACSSPISYRIGRGKHNFIVFATDSLGNRGRAAAVPVQVVKKKQRKSHR